ncbi:MAG: alpha/beta hydrolase [Anaerolineales bacterium]|uniref:alpha/beta fold hydrolase n=1 Tax=Candidatus Villigracilis proximus TaxID=3140683 RepID=UPI0031370FD9|nr:alpha/beta hydrolase [Anaerolineales bacterium]
MGQGEPVFILLHGFGASLFSWRSDRAVIKSWNRHRYDRPAFGLTERPLEWQGESPYGPQAQVDIVIALMDELKIEKAILVGNSAGGTVSMQVALQHPERVQALIVVDAAVYAGGGAPAWSRSILKTPQMDPSVR